MALSGRSPWLLAGGLLATAVAGAAVVWGRVRAVDVPRVGAWEVTPLVCAVGVDRVALHRATEALRAHGHELRVLPAAQPCAAGPGVIAIVVDPTLDTARIVDADPVSIEVDGGELSPLTPQTWGLTACTRDGTAIRQCSIRLHPDAGGLALTHELLHAQGWEHPPGAPTGHVLHPRAPSLDDWRGLDGRAP